MGTVIMIKNPINATTTAFSASLIVKALPGTLHFITGFNNSTSEQYIQVHDAKSLPANAAVPKLFFLVPAKSNFALDFGTEGRYFTSGIVVCNSSTSSTKTIGSADCWFDVQYK